MFMLSYLLWDCVQGFPFFYLGLPGRIRRPEETTWARTHSELGEGCCYKKYHTTAGKVWTEDMGWGCSN